MSPWSVEAACRGARASGGHTIGIMPGFNAKDSPPNPYVEFPVFTGIGFARNSIVVLSGQAVIAIGGAYGTLSELAFALIHGVPLVGIDTWEFVYEGYEAKRIMRVKEPEVAVEAAIALIEGREIPPATDRPAGIGSK